MLPPNELIIALDVPFHDFSKPFPLLLGLPSNDTANIAPVVLPCVLFPHKCTIKLSVSLVVIAKYPTNTEDAPIHISVSAGMLPLT